VAVAIGRKAEPVTDASKNDLGWKADLGGFIDNCCGDPDCPNDCECDAPRCERDGCQDKPTPRPRPDFDPHIDYPERYTDGPI
jgi:hypothetical protein